MGVSLTEDCVCVLISGVAYVCHVMFGNEEVASTVETCTHLPAHLVWTECCRMLMMLGGQANVCRR